MLYVDKRLCEQRTINYENISRKGRKTKVRNAYPRAVQMSSSLGQLDLNIKVPLASSV